MHRFWALLICLATLLVVAGAADGPHETPWWVDFLGQQSTLDNQPLPVGALVRAYDPTGVLAGQSEVTLAGWYLVSVYGDDGMTTLDEGAVASDRIAFTADGYPAVTLGPDAPVWSGSGSRRHVELRACTLAGDFDCDGRVTVADLMRQARSFGVSRGEASYYPPFDRDGDGDVDSGDLQEVAGGWRRISSTWVSAGSRCTRPGDPGATHFAALALIISSAPRYIQTVRGYGHRFVAPVGLPADLVIT